MGKLERRIRKHAKVAFKHIGAKCPRCGYVFKTGFSDVTKAAIGEEPNPREESALTICTGCLSPLRVNGKGAASLISQEEMSAWPLKLRESVAEMKALLRKFKADMPS